MRHYRILFHMLHFCIEKKEGGQGCVGRCCLECTGLGLDNITTQKQHILNNNSHEFFWVVNMLNMPSNTLLPLQEILMVFVKFWRYFKVIFEALSNKREMELRRTNNVDDGEELMHLDQDLELIWRWLRWIQKKDMK